jgi:hypothetical protein
MSSAAVRSEASKPIVQFLKSRRLLVLCACPLAPLFVFGMLAEDMPEKEDFSSHSLSRCSSMPKRVPRSTN